MALADGRVAVVAVAVVVVVAAAAAVLVVAAAVQPTLLSDETRGREVQVLTRSNGR